MLRRSATAVADIFVPTPVRQHWIILYTTIHTTISAYPAQFRYGFLAVTLLAALTELSQPGYLPRPKELSNVIIGLACTTLVTHCALALCDFLDNDKWPWQEDGWVWPWQAWLWKNTAYDPGASTSTHADEPNSPLQRASPALAHSPSTRAAATQTRNVIPIDDKSGRFTFSMPAPVGLRRLDIPSRQTHKSGILGESPMPPKFKYFDGEVLKYDKFKASAGLGSAVGKSVVPEKRGSEGYEGEKAVKKSTAVMYAEVEEGGAGE
jgi:hypothetical protein